MPLLPCKSHETRIAALEKEVKQLIDIAGSISTLSADIIEKLKEERQLPDMDLNAEAYHQ